MATLSALVTSEPAPPLRAGPLRPVLEGLLTKDPARRMSAARAGELLSAAATPPAPEPPPRRVRPRRLAARVGLVPAVTVGVLTLAVAAGVLAGVKGTPAAPRSPSAEPGGGPLPATLGGGTGGPAATRLAHGGATWPATSAGHLQAGGSPRTGLRRDLPLGRAALILHRVGAGGSHGHR